MKFYSFAKLNLCIDIIDKKANGYHEIRTVLHENKTLKDELIFFKTKQKTKTSIKYSKKIPTKKRVINSKNNLISQSIDLLKNRFNISKNIQVHLLKNIPVSSGLGGGSSNAACTLKALNKIWNLKLNNEELIELAKEIGMDVAFFIKGGTALAENYGEKLTQLPKIENIKFELAEKEDWPKFKDFDSFKKTAKMYEKVNLKLCNKNRKKTEKLLIAVKNKNPKGIIKNLHNDFEILLNIKKPWHLSGSGPAIFRAKIARK